MDPISPLTKREREIAELVAHGLSNKQIARQLGLSHQTVRNLLVLVYRKICIRKRTELAVRLVASEYVPVAYENQRMQ